MTIYAERRKWLSNWILVWICVEQFWTASLVASTKNVLTQRRICLPSYSNEDFIQLTRSLTAARVLRWNFQSIIKSSFGYVQKNFSIDWTSGLDLWSRRPKMSSPNREFVCPRIQMRIWFNWLDFSLLHSLSLLKRSLRIHVACVDVEISWFASHVFYIDWF